MLCYLCSIANKILAHVIWKSFKFSFYKKKKNVPTFLEFRLYKNWMNASSDRCLSEYLILIVFASWLHHHLMVCIIFLITQQPVVNYSILRLMHIPASQSESSKTDHRINIYVARLYAVRCETSMFSSSTFTESCVFKKKQGGPVPPQTSVQAFLSAVASDITSKGKTQQRVQCGLRI